MFPMANRLRALVLGASALSHAAAELSARARVTRGVIERSLWRYMPRPAGLIDIDERSAPSDVKAPAMAIERAVPKLNCVCDSSSRSVGITMSLSAIMPPVLSCCAAAVVADAIANAAVRKSAVRFICCCP